MSNTKNHTCFLLIVQVVLSIVIMASGTLYAGENEEVIYRIGPEDVLRIYVWNHPELSLTIPVRIDGKISLPLVNDVQAAGNTPMQLREEIAKGLSKFIELPTVSVIVETINSHKIIVMGNVNAPGVYRIGSIISLLEAVSLSGGLNEWANMKKIKIMRKNKDEERVIVINYKKIIDGSNLKNNIDIKPGDKIVVP